MRKLILALWLLPALVGAQTLLTNVGNRHSTSLNGSWNYIVGLPDTHAQDGDEDRSQVQIQRSLSFESYKST